MTRPDAKTRTAPNVAASRLRQIALGAGLIAGTALWAGQTRAEAHEEIIESHGYSFFGNLLYDADFEHLNYVNPDAPKGGEISTWAPGTFDSFNPYTRQGRSGTLATVGYENVLTTVADDPTASYCLLCTTLEYPESRDWVVFNLRPEARFSDGSPLTAQDMAFTHDLLMEQGLPSYRTAIAGIIENVEVIDDHTIKFTFGEDSPLRDRIELAGGLPVFSKAWYEETGARLDESRLEPGIGSGPYMLSDYDINQRIVYERNPNYWGADLPINVGRNNFDTIRIEYFADGNAAFEAFKAGAYTFRSENSSIQWATGYDFQAVNEGWIVVEELVDGNMAPGQSFVFNLRREKFQDPLVREAIALMFNFEWSNETLFYDLYARIDSFWENSDLAATGVPTEAELALLEPLVEDGLLPASILTEEAVIAPRSSSRQLDRANLARASELLDEAGWLVNDAGMREKDGEILRVEFLESSPAFDRVINPYVQNLERLGVEAKLNRVDPSQETALFRDHEFDMVTHQMPMAFEPGAGLKQFFGSEAEAESTRNAMGVADPAVDSLIESVIRAETEEEMKVAVRTLDRVLRSYRFWVPQWYKNVHTVAYYDMYRHPDPLPPFARGELDFWWFDAEAKERLEAVGAL